MLSICTYQPDMVTYWVRLEKKLGQMDFNRLSWRTTNFLWQQACHTYSTETAELITHSYFSSTEHSAAEQEYTVRSKVPRATTENQTA